MPPADGQTRKTEYSTVIYLRGTQAEQLDDAERRCREYAARFGWHVLASIRDNQPAATLGQFLAKVSRAGAIRARWRGWTLSLPDWPMPDWPPGCMTRAACSTWPPAWSSPAARRSRSSLMTMATRR